VIDPADIEPEVQANGKTVYVRLTMGRVLAIILTLFLLKAVRDEWNVYNLYEITRDAEDASKDAKRETKELRKEFDKSVTDQERRDENQEKEMLRLRDKFGFGDVDGDDPPTGLYIRVPFGWGIA
jgi:hypothetical protein